MAQYQIYDDLIIADGKIIAATYSALRRYWIKNYSDLMPFTDYVHRCKNVKILNENNIRKRNNNMMLLKNAKDITKLVNAVSKCTGDVILRSQDGSETFNLKSTLSQYIAISRLCEDHGDEYEVYCLDRSDEAYMLQFFYELNGQPIAETA